MTRHGLKWVLTCAAAMLAALTTTAPRAAAQPLTDARIEELVRVAARRAAGDQQTPPAAGAAQTAQPTRPAVQLSLDEAVKLALDRNLDIAVQRLNPQQFDLSLAAVRATYSPTVTSLFASQSAMNPSQSTIAGNAAGTGISQNLTTYNGGLSQNFRWGGGGVAVTLNNSRTSSTSLTALFNPSYTPNWAAQYTQPLLRGFSIDSTRQQLVVTKLNQDISEIQLQATIINTLSNVRNAYWDYVYAVQAVEVARQSLSLATKLVQDNQTRVEVGTMAPIDVVSAQSEAATRRQNLVLAEATRRTAELTLKRLIVSGTQDPNWSATLEPTDRPDFRPEPVDVDGAVRRALSARTDLAQAKKNVEVNDVTLKFLRNQILPQADLVARYGLVGLGGTQFITTGTGITRTVTGEIPGGYADALSSLFGRNYPTWNVTVNVSYPLGRSTAEAAVARGRIQLNQVEAQLHQIELQVATDVTNAATQTQSNVEAVQAAQAARELSQRKLEAEQSKFDVGMSTNYFVVQAQRDLSDAQNTELRQILNYRKSLVELERLQQTTLQNSNITVLSTGGLNTTAVGSGRPTVVAGGGGGG